MSLTMKFWMYLYESLSMAQTTMFASTAALAMSSGSITCTALKYVILVVFVFRISKLLLPKATSQLQRRVKGKLLYVKFLMAPHVLRLLVFLNGGNPRQTTAGFTLPKESDNGSSAKNPSQTTTGTSSPQSSSTSATHTKTDESETWPLDCRAGENYCVLEEHSSGTLTVQQKKTSDAFSLLATL